MGADSMEHLKVVINYIYNNLSFLFKIMISIENRVCTQSFLIKNILS
jgi:hypothetical protein